MFLLYVDESGDSGLVNSPTNYFILSGIVIHELRWKSFLEGLVNFRRHLKDTKDLKLREEIHCTNFINSPGELIRIRRNDRLDIMKQCINWLNSQEINIYSVAVNKTNKTEGTDIFECAWKAFIQRFENTISHRNFSGPSNPDERGFILSDNTDGQKLQKLLRKMRHFNYVPDRSDISVGTSRNLPLQYIIEDPVLRDSRESLIHQMNDVVAYFARQLYEPNAYMRRKAATRYYERLSQVNLRVVSHRNPLGIVEI